MNGPTAAVVIFFLLMCVNLLLLSLTPLFPYNTTTHTHAATHFTAAFMDTTVHHLESPELKTDTCRKPTHTCRYLGFTSNHPTSAKRSVVYSLIKRIDNMRIHNSTKKKEEQLIKAELAANG